jgi:hypothetical protein
MTRPTAADLADELAGRGYRVAAFAAEPPDALVASVNLWRDRADRYPWTTIWEPYNGEGWTWGDRFEHTAPDGDPVDKLADAVEATMTP